MQSDFKQSCKAARAAITVSPVRLARIRYAATARPRVSKPRARKVFGASAAALSIALVAATAIVRVTGSHVYLPSSGAMALQFGQKMHIQVFMDPTVPEMRSAAAAADFPVQFPAGLPANSVLRQLLLADHDTIMLQYGLPGAWRRKANTLWIVLANPKSVTGSSDEQSVGHLLALGPKFGPGGKVQERWQIGGEAVIIAQSEALPQELSAIKHAMLAQLARSCGTHARRSKTVVIQYARCR